MVSREPLVVGGNLGAPIPWRAPGNGREPAAKSDASTVRLASRRAMRNRDLELVGRIYTVRMLVFACLVLLGGCNDQLRVVSFEADPAGTFVFTAQTNTVMTGKAAVRADRIRAAGLANDANPRGCALPGSLVESD